MTSTISSNHKKELYTQSQVALAAGVRKPNLEEAIKHVPFGIEKLGGAASYAMRSEKAIAYLAPDSESNHFKALLPDGNTLILMDPYGNHWSEEEIEAIGQAVGSDVELAYLGASGKAVPLNTPEDQLAMLQRNGKRLGADNHDSSNCGVLTSYLVSGWNAKDAQNTSLYRGQGHEDSEIFRGIDPTKGATDEQIDQLRAIQADTINTTMQDMKKAANQKNQPVYSASDYDPAVTNFVELLAYALSALIAAILDDGKKREPNKNLSDSHREKVGGNGISIA